MDVSGEAGLWIGQALERYQGPLIRYASRIVGDRERAKDCVQDAFLKLCQQRREQVERKLAPWLFRVTRNLALDALRKDRRLEFSEESEMKHAVDEKGCARSGPGGALFELASRLPEREQEIVFLKFQQDLSYKEISAVTGLTVGNVGYVLHHALKDLKKLWEEAETV